MVNRAWSAPPIIEYVRLLPSASEEATVPATVLFSADVRALVLMIGARLLSSQTKSNDCTYSPPVSVVRSAWAASQLEPFHWAKRMSLAASRVPSMILLEFGSA